MNRESKAEEKNPRTLRLVCGWTIAAFFFLAALDFSAQAQQGSSPADVARQARAQKQAVAPADVDFADGDAVCSTVIGSLRLP